MGEFSWSPPNAGHFCLLARIEETNTYPYGMTSPEGTDTRLNTQNNNNIAWRNVDVVDLGSGSPHREFGTIWRNIKDVPVRQNILVKIAAGQDPALFMRNVEIQLELDQLLFDRWLQGGSSLTGMQYLGNRTFKVLNVQNASLNNIALNARESGTILVRFNLLQGYIPGLNFDIHMTHVEGSQEQGGVKFEVHLKP